MLTALSHLRAMQGDFATARDLYGNARAILEELGWKMMAALTSIDSGVVELLAGDPVAAERELRGDYDTLEAMGERNYISTTAAFLADALAVQDRDDEAIAFTEVSESIAAPDDVSSQSLWRLVRGRVLARRGDLDGAEALVREGLAIIRTSDEPDSQGNALVDLAEVLRLAGRDAEAEAGLREALGLFEAKGNLVSAGRARAKLATVGVTAARD
jgi:tetratricopeptide (TPR) repeat protein